MVPVPGSSSRLNDGSSNLAARRLANSVSADVSEPELGAPLALLDPCAAVIVVLVVALAPLEDAVDDVEGALGSAVRLTLCGPTGRM